jgi:predicted O-methyltransferase YrrM
MLEFLFNSLPESARACRRLYQPENGGYNLPPRDRNHLLRESQLADYVRDYSKVQYDCVEVPVADLLYTLVVNTHARRVLETGTSRGFSTCHLAAGVACNHGDAGLVVSVDLEALPSRFFENSAVGRCVQAVTADSLAWDPAPVLGDEPLDFIFFDSLHSYEHLGAEIARYLPLLRTGGLFALHDSFFYDALALVVLHLQRTELVEALSLPSHRRHQGEGMRCPGVTLFRKIAPIAPGQVCFPDLAGLVSGEVVSLPQPERVVQRLGSVGATRHYVAHGMADAGPRKTTSPSLLAPR